MSVLYSGVAGSHEPQDAAHHIKNRIQTSHLDTDTLDALTTPPTNKASDDENILDVISNIVLTVCIG